MRSSKLVSAVVLVVLAVAALPVYAEPQNLSARIEDNKVIVEIEGKLFTCYKFDHSQKYPYFWPVNGPLTGESVTTETSQPYPHHHSLFFGCDRVNGANYWQDVNARGQILSQGPRLIRDEGPRIIIMDECLWKQPEKEPVIRDRRFIMVTAPDERTRIIDFRIAINPLTDIEILKTNHSLFSARMVPELSVKSGGTLVNAEGQTSEKGTFGQASVWCDYSGTRDGKTEGLAIMQSPRNRWFPSKWFTRDYGFFSPTPMYWLEGGKLNLSEDSRLALSYRVVVHTGDCESAGIEELWSEYEQREKEDRPRRRGRGRQSGSLDN